ncbi:hypothetical protein ACWERV_23100 [Streptomyces sp. NPDC004031]
MNPDSAHFTAWITKDPQFLETDRMDVLIMEDTVMVPQTTPDGRRIQIWETDGNMVFYAVTSVDAREGDVYDAMKEAELLMQQAGWRTVGPWGLVPEAPNDHEYIATVEPNA